MATTTDYDWKFILGLVCFALGAALILLGILRLIWYFTGRSSKKQQSQRVERNAVKEYYNSPWLKSSVYQNAPASPNRHDDDVLRGVDVNALMHSTDGGRTQTHVYSLSRNHRITLDSDDIDNRGQYAVPSKPKKLVVKDSDPQILQISKLQEQQELTMSLHTHSTVDDQQRSVSSEHSRVTGQSREREVLSALDAATAGEEAGVTPRPLTNGHKTALNGHRPPNGSLPELPARSPAQGQEDLTFPSPPLRSSHLEVDPSTHYDTIPAARGPLPSAHGLSRTPSNAGARVVSWSSDSPKEVSWKQDTYPGMGAPVLYQFTDDVGISDGYQGMGAPVVYMDEDHHRQTMQYIDRTLAEEDEVEYKFSSTVYVNTL